MKLRSVLAVVLVAGTTAAGVPPPAQDPVTRWVETRAHPIAADGDLAPLGRSVRAARIVGLGEPAHRLAEITGTYDVAPGQRVELPAPLPAWFEHPLGSVRAEQFLYEVDGRAPEAVRAWMRAPMITRGYAEAGHASTMAGGTPGGWFDLIVHRRQVTPATPLA